MSYVKVYDDVLPKSLCESIISKFELQPQNHVITYLENHRSFTEININQHIDTWKNGDNIILIL